MDTPVAPIGWPFAFRPPDRLIGSCPSFCGEPSSNDRVALAAVGQPHGFVVDQFGDGEAVVGFDQVQIVEVSPACSSAAARPARAVELDRIAPATAAGCR